MNTELRILIETAASLASEQGENPEYDRALVELIANLMPDDARQYIAGLVLAPESPLHF